MRSSVLTVIVLSLAAAAVAATAVLASLSNRPADHFSRDPLAVVEEAFYVGLLSNITAAFWFAASGAAWLTTVVLARARVIDHRPLAMGLAACLISLLGADDLFMLHEEALQRHLGIDERLTVAFYAVVAASIGWRFRVVWLRTPWPIVALAAAFFASSIAVDVLTSGFGWRIVIEDSLKFMGVACILAWTLGCGLRWLAPMPDVQSERVPLRRA